MYTTIANLDGTKASYLNKTIPNLVTDSKNKIYGVDFSILTDISLAYNDNGTNNTFVNSLYGDMGLRSKGVRLFDAKDYNFSPSTTTDPGVDNFTDDNAGPFMIRECCTRYNETTGKQEVVSYEGDSTWDTDKVNTDYNRMIEFPLFYYYRPNAYTLLLSETKINDNFIVSPMHYKDSVKHDYIYISKDLLDSNYKSGQAKAASFSCSIENVNTLRTTLIDEHGLYLADHSVYYSIFMLMLVKYANLCVGDYAFGSSYLLSAVNYDDILSKDGSMTYSTYTLKTGFGLINFGYNDFMDGVLGYHQSYTGDIYLSPINTSITSYPITNSSSSTTTIESGWVRLLSDFRSSSSRINRFELNSVYPYIYYGSVSDSSSYIDIPIEMSYSYSSILLWGGGTFKFTSKSINGTSHMINIFNIIDDAVNSRNIRVYCYCD